MDSTAAGPANEGFASTVPTDTSLAAAAQRTVAALQPLPLDRYALVEAIVNEDVGAFAEKYFEKRMAEMDKGEGLLSKIGNDFYRVFDLEYAAFSTVTRSFDSALGTCLQNMVIRLTRLTYLVQTGAENKLQNPLSKQQQQAITAMLERGVTPALMADLADPAARITDEDAAAYALSNPKDGKSQCDMVVHLPGECPLVVEVKSGGMLDDKKASAEKRGELEYCAHYFNAHGVMPQLALAVLYDVNDRSGKAWSCSTVQNAFSADELLVGRAFWNFVLNASDGYDVFMSFYHPASRQLNDVVRKLVRNFVSKAQQLLAQQAAQTAGYVPAGTALTPFDALALVAAANPAANDADLGHASAQLTGQPLDLVQAQGAPRG